MPAKVVDDDDKAMIQNDKKRRAHVMGAAHELKLNVRVTTSELKR